MNHSTVAQNEPAVVAYARLLRRLHELIAQNADEGLEGNAIRDEMDPLWYASTDAENERVGGLSEDLYAMAEKNTRGIPMYPVMRNGWEEEYQEAFDAHDYDRALLLLRRPPNDLTLSAIHLRQSLCWERLGDPETARVFREAAERLAHGSRDSIPATGSSENSLLANTPH